MERTGKRRLRIGVFKFASCDGCQLSLLDAEDELLEIAEAVEIAYFPEASRRMAKGPYDIGLVEGSITTHQDAERIQQVRRQCRTLVTLGACATAGGIQALRNWTDVSEYVRQVYPRPDYIQTLRMSTPIAEHVPVDLELRGCPINKGHLVELVAAVVVGRKPNIPTYSVCLDCKRQGVVCVLVARGMACLGPVTQAGCGALCPRYGRPCYGCFGPMEAANASSLSEVFRQLGHAEQAIVHSFRNFNAWALPFRLASQEAGRK